MRQSSPAVFSGNRKNVLVQGCSFTYGLGVKPEETFCWRMNMMQPEYLFHNGGMVGAGPCIVLMNLPWELEQHDYDLVLYAVISDHVSRDKRIRLVNDTADREIINTASDIFMDSFESKFLLDGKIHTLTLFWNHFPWLGEDKSRFVAFLHHLWTDMSALPIDDENGEYNNPEYRFCSAVRACYTQCALRNIPFALVELHGFEANGLVEVLYNYYDRPLKQLVATPLNATTLPPPYL